MSGMDINQRGTLTANHGKYYIDTSVSEETQKSGYFTTERGAPLINVFRGNQTYHVFFIYAKPTTQQTYQIYVGQEFNPETLRAVRAKFVLEPLDKNEFNYFSDSRPSWLTIDSFDRQKGLLTVSINFNNMTEDMKKQLTPSPANLCRPSSFCEPNNNNDQCGCAMEASRYPLLLRNPDFNKKGKECDRVCNTWAVKDLDCPKMGCLGFAFTLSDKFVADGSGQKVRLQPEPFPTTAVAGKPDWTTQFRRTEATSDGKPGSACYYPVIPGPACSQ